MSIVSFGNFEEGAKWVILPPEFMCLNDRSSNLCFYVVFIYKLTGSFVRGAKFQVKKFVVKYYLYVKCIRF